MTTARSSSLDPRPLRALLRLTAALVLCGLLPTNRTLALDEGAESAPAAEPLRLTARDLPGVRYPVQWRTDWERALAEATARNVPVLLVVHREGDRLCDATRMSLWPDRAFMDLADDEVVPIAVLLPPTSDEFPPHDEVAADPSAGLDAHCPLFPTVRCSDHRSLATQIPEAWRGGSGVLPERRLIHPDGRTVLSEPARLPPGINAERLADEIKKARKTLGERRTTRVQLHFALVRLERMTDGVERREFRAPCLDLRAFRRSQETLPASLIAEADALEAKIRAEAQRLLERARSVEERSPRGALQVYKVILDEFPGLPEGEIARKKFFAKEDSKETEPKEGGSPPSRE